MKKPTEIKTMNDAFKAAGMSKKDQKEYKKLFGIIKQLRKDAKSFNESFPDKSVQRWFLSEQYNEVVLLKGSTDNILKIADSILNLDIPKKVKTIQSIVEIQIHELQNEDAKNNWGNYSDNQCCLCGKKVGKDPKMVHYLTNGNITSIGDEDQVPNSQGFFVIGSECAKKLPINFIF